jgi:hypothetical protein
MVAERLQGKYLAFAQWKEKASQMLWYDVVQVLCYTIILSRVILTTIIEFTPFFPPYRFSHDKDQAKIEIRWKKRKGDEEKVEN